MMDEPGCNAGRAISPMPARGPEFIQRRSLAIFVRATASTRSCPDSATTPSWLLIRWKGLGVARNDSPLSSLNAATRREANSGCVLTPVPTAVPPIARTRRSSRAPEMRREQSSSWALQLPRDWSKRRGMASIRCVRPVLLMPPRLSALRRITDASRSSAGSSCCRPASTVLTWIALGITSLLLWPKFTWSLGWTSTPEASVAERAITSLAFMLLLVPEPVWYTSTGNCSISCPSPRSVCTAATMAWATSPSMHPRWAFTPAAAPLIASRACTKAWGMTWPLMGKLSTARWVWGPYSASRGICTSPMLSLSVRVGLSGRLALGMVLLSGSGNALSTMRRRRKNFIAAASPLGRD